jgi:hypothetical protein
LTWVWNLLFKDVEMRRNRFSYLLPCFAFFHPVCSSLGNRDVSVEWLNYRLNSRSLYSWRCYLG